MFVIHLLCFSPLTPNGILKKRRRSFLGRNNRITFFKNSEFLKNQIVSVVKAFNPNNAERGSSSAASRATSLYIEFVFHRKPALKSSNFRREVPQLLT